MTLRSLASSLGIAASLCLAAFATAQEPGKPAPATPKAQAAAEAKKAADADTTTTKEKTEAPKADVKSEKKVEVKSEKKTEKAVFAGGCFWCLEAFFERIHGVKSVVSGYSGGDVARPSYEMVCTGLTGHAESVAIEYDPKLVSYDYLLDVFWLCHDPTTLNRQGPDEGTQYRSVIFYVDDEQKKLAEKSYQKANAYYNGQVVTQLVPLVRFWPAERHHQDYFRLNKFKNPYCINVIAPKIEELRAKLNAKAAATPAPTPAPAPKKP